MEVNHFDPRHFCKDTMHSPNIAARVLRGRPSSLLICVIALLASAPALRAEAEESVATEGRLQGFDLPGGAKLWVLHAPGAPRQTAIAMLPCGLLNDDPQRAQYSHLAEHALIRSVVPPTLMLNEIEFNGETTALAMRLESYAAPKDWQRALELQLQMLTARSFSAELIEFENARIEQELDGTVRFGATHKWALAAWNQVVRHGQSHASIRGDVRAATPQRLAEFVDSRLGDLSDLQLVCAGPAAPLELQAFLAKELEQLGGNPSAASAQDTPINPARSPRLQSQTNATWDLPVRQYMEWIPVPGASGAQKVSAKLFAQLATLAFMQSGDPALMSGKALAQSDMITSEGRFILFSVSLREDEEPAEVQASLHKALAKALSPRGMTLELFLMQMRMQAGAAPDFEAIRSQLQGRGRADLIEAQFALQLALERNELGLDADALDAARRAVGPAQLETLAKLCAPGAQRASLLLETK